MTNTVLKSSVHRSNIAPKLALIIFLLLLTPSCSANAEQNAQTSNQGGARQIDPTNSNEEAYTREQLIETLGAEVKQDEAQWPMVTQTFVIDGRQYDRSQLIWDFIKVALGDNFQHENTLKPWSSAAFVLTNPGASTDTEEYYDRMLPWLSEYMFRPKGIPRSNSIIKWDRPLLVSLYWPQYGDLNLNISADISEESRLLIEDTAKTVLEDIESLTGLDAEYVPIKKEQKEDERYARIRIIPKSYRPTLDKDYLKFHNPFHGYGRFVAKIFGALEFGSFSDTRARGILIPEADNTLGLASCYVAVDLGESTLKRNLTECLLRSVGLPDISMLNPSSLLGTSTEATISELSGYDRFVVSLLYCADIRPGMDRNQVVWLLNTSEQCFEHSIKQVGD